MATLYPPSCTAASTALGYILHALGIDRVCDFRSLPGLPHGLHIAERDALLITTPTPAPLFRTAAEDAAATARLDLALVRVEEGADGAVTMSVDLTLAALPHAPWPMPDLALWTSSAGQLWLVPAGFGASVAVTDEGFLLDLVPPYASRAERAVGIARAARAIGVRSAEAR